MKRMRRLFDFEDGFGMLQLSMLLGFIAVAIAIAMFVMSTGGAATVGA